MNVVLPPPLSNLSAEWRTAVYPATMATTASPAALEEALRHVQQTALRE